MAASMPNNIYPLLERKEKGSPDFLKTKFLIESDLQVVSKNVFSSFGKS